MIINKAARIIKAVDEIETEVVFFLKKIIIDYELTRMEIGK